MACIKKYILLFIVLFTAQYAFCGPGYQPPGGDGDGDVSVDGTPSADEFAIWLNATTIKGVTPTGTGSPVNAISPTITTPTLSGGSATVDGSAYDISSNTSNDVEISMTNSGSGDTNLTVDGTVTAEGGFATGAGVGNTNQWGSTGILQYCIDGIMKLTGLGDGANLDISIDLDNNGTTIKISTADGSGYDFDGKDVHTTGIISGGPIIKTISANYTVGTDDAREMYGGVITVTANAEVEAPLVVNNRQNFTLVTQGLVTLTGRLNAANSGYFDGYPAGDGSALVTDGGTNSIQVWESNGVGFTVMSDDSSEE